MKKRRWFEKHQEPVFLLVVICLVFTFFYRNLPVRSMWAFSDLSPFDYVREVDIFLSSWNSQFLGFHYEAMSRTLIFILEFLIKNDIIVQKVYFLSLLPLSFMTMYIFNRKFFSSFWSRVFSSLLYAINPVTIGEFVNGSTWMIVYAFAPFIFYLLLKIYESQKSILFYGLCLSILIGLSIGPTWILLWTLLPTPFIAFSKLLCVSGERDLKLFLKRSILISVFILIGFTLLLPTMYQMVFTGSSAFRPQSIASYFNDVNYCYSRATLLNLLRLAGDAGSPMDALGYNSVTWWTIPGMIIPIIAFIPLINRKKERRFFDLTICLMIFLIILFIFLTYRRVTYSLFSEFPFLFSLRNPKYLIYPLAFGTSFMFGRGLDTLFNLIKKSLNKKKQILTVFFVLITVSSSLAIYAYPVWGGNMGKRTDSYVVPQSYYEIVDMLKKMDNNNEFYRVLWLPYTYQTQIRIIDIQQFGARLGQDVLSTPNVEFVEDLFKRIEYNNHEIFSEILALFNVKYVVIDKTQSSNESIKVYKQWGTPFIKGDPELFDRFMNEQNGFFKIFESDEFSIYQNSFYLPYLSTTKLSNLKQNVGKKELKLPTEQLFVYQGKEDTLYFLENLSENVFNPVNHYNRDKSTLLFEVNITEPSFITMAESYDPEWVAYANGKELPHLRALGWANGFLISEPGKYKIEILFRPQHTRNLMIGIWIAAWSTTLIVFLYITFRIWRQYSINIKTTPTTRK